MKKIKIGKKEYKAKFNLGALIRFQEQTGMNPFEGDVLGTLDPIKLKALLLAVILDDVKEEEIDNIGFGEFNYLIETIQEILSDSPEAKN